MPTKIYRIKSNDCWINVSYSPPHYAHQKTKKSNMPKMTKMPSNHNKSNFKITETAPFHRTDFRTFQ